MGRNSLDATKARRILAVRAARAARLPAAVFFFVFFDFVVFFAWLAEPVLDFPVAAVDFLVVELREWPAEGANAISAESTTTSHRAARLGACKGEEKTISSLYSAFAFNARRLEPALSIRPECLARAFFWRLPALHV